MIFYLRNNKNKDIDLAEVEIYLVLDSIEANCYVELNSYIYISNYSTLLLETTEEKKIELIKEFDNISELRGWMWEKYFAVKKNTQEEFYGVMSEVKAMLNSLASKHELCVVED